MQKQTAKKTAGNGNDKGGKKGGKNCFANHGGKFLTLRTRTREQGERKYCAKILAESPFYVTFLNVTSGEVLKVSKSSII
jgi:hypothetical protein